MNIRILAGLVALALPFSSLAYEDADKPAPVVKSVMFRVDVPQLLGISSPDDPDKVLHGTDSNVTWVASTNNGFDITFTGSTPAEVTGGTPLTYPLFHKEDYDADGNIVPNEFDHLENTVYGIVVTGHHSVAEEGSVGIWGGGSATTNGTPQNLVASAETLTSPNGVIGTIMSDDNASTASITLHAVGTADLTKDQSGDYKAVVVITLTPDEKWTSL